jgi:hypothetical protein
MHSQMRTLRVLHLSSDLPPAVLDQILTAAEQALEDHGASRIWTAAEHRGVTVLAEVPSTPPDDGPQPAPVIDLQRRLFARDSD